MTGIWIADDVLFAPVRAGRGDARELARDLLATDIATATAAATRTSQRALKMCSDGAVADPGSEAMA